MKKSVFKSGLVAAIAVVMMSCTHTACFPPETRRMEALHF